MYVINPDYMSVLFNDNIGQHHARLGGGLRMVVGFLWMKKIIDIEI